MSASAAFGLAVTPGNEIPRRMEVVRYGPQKLTLAAVASAEIGWNHRVIQRANAGP